ncbi:hypothetical protein FDUTEX481_09278 [Tolypothrix sp. PCC 7601]|nr:hypothetical protein FDUTEX481_09278 [Tolypothrix sp. PCC 7601]
MQINLNNHTTQILEKSIATGNTCRLRGKGARKNLFPKPNEELKILNRAVLLLQVLASVMTIKFG